MVGQTCDLVCANDALEPYTEILVARQRTGKPKPDLVARKSSRQLHLPLSSEAYLSFDMVDRCFVRRSLLDRWPPDGARSLSKEASAEVVAWLVQRYRRTAFPNEFEARLSERLDAIEVVLKKCADIREIRIAIKPALDVELGTSDSYTVAILGICRSSLEDDQPRFQAALRALQELEQEMAECRGIKVSGEGSRLMPERQVTLEHLKIYHLWNRDWISNRANYKAQLTGAPPTHDTPTAG